MGYIGAEHEFHSTAFARDWAERFKQSPIREKLFDDLCNLIAPHVEEGKATVVELGTGPGFLAEWILDRFSTIEYVGVDFSSAMLAIARERVAHFHDRTSFLQVDLLGDELPELLDVPVQAVVSTWSLHDLGGADQIHHVYNTVQGFLRGMLVNGDFIDPEITGVAYEPGRVSVERHLEMLRELGYQEVRCEGIYEYDKENPTPANNYACIVATYQPE